MRVENYILIFGVVLSVLFASCGAVAAGQVNAFIYHRFDESRYPSTNIAASVFRQQLEYLKTHNIEVIGLDNLSQRLNSGRALPEHAAALSVDDGYSSFYDVALPIIEEYGFPVSLFVNTDAVGKRGYMSWDQLQDAQRRGIIIANHTASHPYMIEAVGGETYQTWKQRISHDIATAQHALEMHLGAGPGLFAYPYGEYSPEVVAIVKDAGFDVAFAQQSGVITEATDLYVLPRFPMGGPFATLDGFISKLNMKPLVVTDGAEASPVITTINPPTLLLKIPDLQTVRGVNCFVQGDNGCQVDVAADKGAHWFRVKAEKPLSGRRNKYTLTVRNEQGGWSWFSHLWINADHAAGK